MDSVWPDFSLLQTVWAPAKIAAMDDEDEQREVVADITRWATRADSRIKDIEAFLIWKFGAHWADGFDAYMRSKLDGPPNEG